ncbi:MAG TPA: hypothetical protein VGE12_23010 [Noviherbaspirillum sp.]
MLAKATLPTSVNTVLALAVLAASLAGCGGGSRGDAFAPASSANKDASKPHEAIRPAQTDWVMYAHSATVTGASGRVTTEGYLTRTYQSVLPDGRIRYTETSSETGSGFRPATGANLDATGAMIGYKTNGGESCTFAPAFVGVASITPGFERTSGSYPRDAAWNVTTQATCEHFHGSAFAGSVNNTGAIVATEQVTVQGKTYHALKEVYTVTATPSAGSSNATARKVDYTCWRDPVLGRMVKCNVTQSSMAHDATAFREEARSTFELAGYALNPHPLRLPSVSHFAGNWLLRYNGTRSGSCTEIRIATDGTISGDCPVTPAGAVQGSVNASGEITVTTAGGASFTGLLRTPVEGNGTWTATGGGSGAWSISHR